MRTDFFKEEDVRECIKRCQERGHIQYAFSTFHNALTQICFTCGNVRTSLNKDEVTRKKDVKK